MRQHGGRRRVGAELNVGGGLSQKDVRANVVRASGNDCASELKMYELVELTEVKNFLKNTAFSKDHLNTPLLGFKSILSQTFLEKK